MTHAGERRRIRAALAAAALLGVCASAPSAAAAQSSGTLSARLAELAGPALRAAPHTEQAEALSVAPAGPGSLLRRGNRVLVEVRFDSNVPAAVDGLRNAGSEIVAVSRRYRTVTVAAKPAELRALAGLDRVESAREVLAPVTRASPCSGSITSEGDTQLAAAAARANFGVDGSGVTVGILSDSFDRDPTAATNAGGDIAGGDLPGPGNPCGRTRAVNVLSDFLASEPSDEGRGMAQIVHDLAPGATIDFATAFSGETAFANSIKALAAAGASVIVDDVGYLEEPVFQDGQIAVAINEVVGDGVSYFSAVGNDNLVDGVGNEFSTWETPVFRDAPGCPAALETLSKIQHCLDFDPGPGTDDTFGIKVEEDETLTVDVQWAEPWEGVDADIDAFLLDSSGAALEDGGGVVGSTSDNVGKPPQKSVEVFSWENTGPEQEVQLAINRCFSTPLEAEKEEGCNFQADPSKMPRLKLLLLENGDGVTDTEYPQSSGPDVVGPAVYGHSGGAGTISVAAVPFNNPATVETYSSRGPSLHLFGPLTGTSAPAAAIPPQTIPKPDIAATDCGQTTFFQRVGKTATFRFCGTSAAAPHAAAVAALALQANPSLSPAEIRSGLGSTARPVGAFGPNAVGAGLIDAEAMIGGFALPPAVSITGPPASVSRNRSPSIAFGANRPVSFTCEFDGSAPFPCSSPFTPSEPLEDGLHGFAVSGTDLAGKRGVSPSVLFTVDTIPPRTLFQSRPPKTIRTARRRAKAVFRFRSNEQDTQFTCRVDGGLFRFCPPRLGRRFTVGRHSVRVKAVDLAGNVDPTPAVYRFEVRRVGSS